MVRDEIPDVRVAEHGLAVALAALITSLVVIVAPLVIVVHAVTNLVQVGRYLLAAAAAIGFPITFAVWPWTHSLLGIPLWIVFLAAWVALIIRRHLGR